MATKLYIPNLLEFMYGYIIGKGKTKVFDLLGREDFKKVKDESAVRKFAQYANIEDKMLLLSKLGMGVVLTFYDKEKQHQKKVEDIVIAYIEADPKDITKLLVNDKLFAARDIDFIKSLQTIAHTCNSHVYSVNRRFLAIREKSISTKILSNKIEAEKNLHWYAETILFGLDIEPMLEAYDIGLIEFKILLQLHTAPNGVTFDYLSGKLRRSNITGMVNRMYKKNMLTFNINNENIILIDVYGITLLQQIFNKFP